MARNNETNSTRSAAQYSGELLLSGLVGRPVYFRPIQVAHTLCQAVERVGRFMGPSRRPTKARKVQETAERAKRRH